VQPPVPIDPVWQARLEQAYRPVSPTPWTETESSGPLLTQIQPLLGEDAEPDPTFFVESWTVGVTAASENYLRRHESPKTDPLHTPVVFSSFSFVTFLNVDPPAPVRSSSPSKPATDFPSARIWDEEDTGAFAPGPLTFHAACQLLGVSATSTREQIKAAYRKMASRYHPDRIQSAGSIDPQLASDRMASINEAYRLLCDVLIEQSA
jgi:hypothetical protein